MLKISSLVGKVALTPLMRSLKTISFPSQCQVSNELYKKFDFPLEKLQNSHWHGFENHTRLPQSHQHRRMYN